MALSDEIAKQMYHEFEPPYHIKSHYRFKLFHKNLKKMVKHNSEKHSWTMGINDFADLTPQEISEQMLMEPINSMDCHGLDKKEELKAPKKFKSPKKNLNAEVGKHPGVFDHKFVGLMSPAKNQGYCGAMWAFSAVGSLEGFWNKKDLGAKNKTFSEQYILDCNLLALGCDGGNPEAAFDFSKYSVFREDGTYPYAGYKSECRPPKDKGAGKLLTPAKVLPPGDEDQMADDLYNEGPLAHGFYVNPEEFPFYRSGIFQSRSCDGLHKINHWMVLSGYGEYALKPFWNAKNSWGSDWGEEGYVRILRGNNMCEIASCVSYPTGIVSFLSSTEEATA